MAHGAGQDHRQRQDGRARRAGARRRRGGGGGLRGAHPGLALLLALGLGCAPQRPPPPPPAPPPPLTEQPLEPTTSTEFAIGPITQTPSADGKELYVEGTVRNIGSRASRDVKVAVEALDAVGSVVARAEALPTPQAVPPGTVATYVVRLPNDPAITTVRVEAIGH